MMIETNKMENVIRLMIVERVVISISRVQGRAGRL
jgi:hypothetical protein